MSSLGDELCTYLQGQSLGLNFSGAGSINLFSTLMPDQPDLAAAVIERGGLPSLMVMGTPASRLDRPTVQIRVRSGMTGYTVGNTMVQGIFKALQGLYEVTLNPGGSLFHLISCLQSPVYLGRDERERHMWSQNYNIWWSNHQR